MKEQWKYIPGCEGRLEISNYGFYRKVGTREKKIGTRVNRGNYLCVHYVDNNGKDCWSQIHRLVAKVFIENPRNAPQVDHIDSNPRNNRADNLRWVFPKENLRNDATRMKRKQPSLFQKSHKFTLIEVKKKEVLTFYHTIRDAAKAIGCCESTASRILNGEQESFKGTTLKRIYNKQLNLF